MLPALPALTLPQTKSLKLDGGAKLFAILVVGAATALVLAIVYGMSQQAVLWRRLVAWVLHAPQPHYAPESQERSRRPTHNDVTAKACSLAAVAEDAVGKSEYNPDDKGSKSEGEDGNATPRKASRKRRLQMKPTAWRLNASRKAGGQWRSMENSQGEQMEHVEQDPRHSQRVVKKSQWGRSRKEGGRKFERL